MIVPNKFPSYGNSRIALIGEAPGKDEVARGEPFVGASGRLLRDVLQATGLSKEACFLGNVSQHQPSGNDISLFTWDGMEIQSGLEQLRKDLDSFNPNIVVLLGNVALKAAKDPETYHPLKPKFYRYKNSNWRGSLFIADGMSVLSGRKCIASYHPAYVLRDYSTSPLLAFDLTRAKEESLSPTLFLSQRTLVIASGASQVIGWLRQARAEKWHLSTDIEGYLFRMSCISLAPSKDLSYIIPFFNKQYKRTWSDYEDQQILRELCITMQDVTVPKTFQNGLYDRFVLQYSYNIPVLGNRDDTMLKGWELNSELEKGLATLASVYTRQPYYKGNRKSQDDTTFFEYCGLDSAVTMEISQNLENMLKGSSMVHYRLNMDLLNPLLYMELRGIRYDIAQAEDRRQKILHLTHRQQASLNSLTGFRFEWKKQNEAFTRARETMGFKRAKIENFDDLCSNCKKGTKSKPYREWAKRLRFLFNQPNPDLATIGEVEDLCEVSLNLDTDRFKEYLYETLKLPKQWNKDKETGEDVLTADYEALLKLSRHCIKESLSHELQVVQLAIEIRALTTRAGMLGISADGDGRIRCGYNLVGSETGRIACYTSPTGSGYNLQTIPKYTNPKDAPGGVLGDRDLFLADEDHWFFQCDLSGADGWTYAAYSAMLGDSTMLDDYRYGLKPAKILALMLRGSTVNFSDRAALKEASKTVDSDEWDYFACKRVQHGAAYLEGEIVISRSILKDSEGKLFLPPPECGKLKRFYYQRYWGIPKWHQWMASNLKRRPVLTAASGQVRRFFGRPDEILTKAVAFEPQANTTYATNLAMFRLWTDPDNRLLRERSSPRSNDNDAPCGGETIRDTGVSLLLQVRKVSTLRIEPLHQVHDALCGQFLKTDTDWASTKIKDWFSNTLNIAGQKIVIPYEGGYGLNWGDLKEGKL